METTRHIDASLDMEGQLGERMVHEVFAEAIVHPPGLFGYSECRNLTSSFGRSTRRSHPPSLQQICYARRFLRLRARMIRSPGQGRGTIPRSIPVDMRRATLSAPTTRRDVAHEPGPHGWAEAGKLPKRSGACFTALVLAESDSWEPSVSYHRRFYAMVGHLQRITVYCARTERNRAKGSAWAAKLFRQSA